MKNNIKIDMTATNINITFARGAIASFLVDSNLTINGLNEIKTIVSEAVTNAIVHGYENDSTKIVHLEFDLTDDNLMIIVKDEGIGIADVEKAKEPLFTTKIQEERAGLGFTIMEIFSDNLEVISKQGVGTTIICTKRLESDEQDESTI